LDWDRATETSNTTADALGIAPRVFQQLGLEYQAGRDLQIEGVRADAPAAAHLDPNQQLAWNYLLSLFGADKALAREHSNYLFQNDPEPAHDWSDARGVGFAINDPFIVWSEVIDTAEQDLADKPVVLQVFRHLWDDIALSTELETRWAQPTAFGLGADLSSDEQRRQGFYDFMYDRVDQSASVQFYAGDLIDVGHPGVITSEDVDRFAQFIDARLLASSISELIDPDGNGAVNKYDIRGIRGVVS